MRHFGGREEARQDALADRGEDGGYTLALVRSEWWGLSGGVVSIRIGNGTPLVCVDWFVELSSILRCGWEEHIHTGSRWCWSFRGQWKGNTEERMRGWRGRLRIALRLLKWGVIEEAWIPKYQHKEIRLSYASENHNWFRGIWFFGLSR